MLIEQFQALNQPEYDLSDNSIFSGYGKMGNRLEDEEGGEPMKCSRCGKPAYKSTTTEAIELGFGLLVIRNIPCYKCNECDEIFYTGDVVLKLEAIISEAKQMMQDLCIVDYSQAA